MGQSLSAFVAENEYKDPMDNEIIGWYWGTPTLQSIESQQEISHGKMSFHVAFYPLMLLPPFDTGTC